MPVLTSDRSNLFIMKERHFLEPPFNSVLDVMLGSPSGWQHFHIIDSCESLSCQAGSVIPNLFHAIDLMNT